MFLSSFKLGEVGTLEDSRGLGPRGAGLGMEDEYTNLLYSKDHQS